MRVLGSAKLAVSVLGFGGAPIGNLYQSLDEEEAEATIDAAFDAGITYFDTAPLYGHGLSEHRLGRVLRNKHRDQFVLSTKVGRRLFPTDPKRLDYGQFPACLPFAPSFDYSYDGTMRSIDDSLQRLGMNRIDIALIHDIDTWTHKEPAETEMRYQEAMTGAYPALIKLRSQGVVGAIGAGVNEWEVCERLAKSGDFDCFLLAGRYTLLEHEAADSFLPLCNAKSISVIIGGPYNTGILASGATSGAYYNYEPAPEHIRARVRDMEKVCQQHRVTLAAAALQFPLAQPAVVGVIPGARSTAEVTENVKLVTESIPTAFWQELKDRYLLPEEVPVPETVVE